MPLPSTFQRSELCFLDGGGSVRFLNEELNVATASSRGMMKRKRVLRDFIFLDLHPKGDRFYTD